MVGLVKQLSFWDRAVLAATNAGLYLRFAPLVYRFRKRCGFWPNLAKPQCVSELLQWRKIFDHDPRHVTFCDKLATKDYIGRVAPDLSLPETLWVGEEPEAIPDRLLVPGYVTKTNNSSGQNYLPHRERWDRSKINQQFRQWLRTSDLIRRRSWRDKGQEWAYWQVPPKVFVERQIEAPRLLDISVRVFDGKASVVSCALDHKTPAKTMAYFDRNGTRTHPKNHPETNTLAADFTVPPTFHAAVQVAERLGRGFDFLRCDFLATSSQIFGGEITCYPASGIGGGDDEEHFRAMYRQWLGTLDISWALSIPPRGLLRRIYLSAFRHWLKVRRAAVMQSA